MSHWVDSLSHFFLDPFLNYVFLRKALIGCCALSIGCGPIGTFMVLRRMSLVGDALTHGLLPGIALAFLISGFSIVGLSIGGICAGLTLAFTSQWIHHNTRLSIDSSFTAMFLISTALGLLILAIFGNHLDLMHVLLGTVLSLSKEGIFWIASISSISLAAITFLYRPLVLRSFDPLFFKSIGGKIPVIDAVFIALVTVNLVSAFQALGTLMALGLLLLPAITARLFAKQVWTMALYATGLGCLASYLGLLLSYHAACPSGPAIILVSGGLYGLAILIQRCWNRGSALALLGLVIGLLMFLPPPEEESADQDKRPQVVVSFTILEDFVKELANDFVRIKTLVGPDGDPHTYDPSPTDIIALIKADLIIVNGLNLEGHWMERFLKAQKQVVIASEGCLPRTLLMGQQPVTDPHAWHNVEFARLYIQNIGKALKKRLPQKAVIIDQRMRAYDQRLALLDRWIRRQMSHVPQKRRRVLTTHDGFGYFGQAYGVSFLSPWGLSTDVEPSPKKMQEMLDAAKRKDFNVIFLENMINPQTLYQIAEETGVRIGGTLYSDALSEADSPASNYMDMMAYNTNILVQGMTHRTP